MAKYRIDNAMPHYSLTTDVYGTEAEVVAKIARAKEALEATGGAFMTDDAVAVNDAAMHGERQGSGVLDDDELRLLNYRPGPGKACFSPVVPAREAGVRASLRLARSVFRKYGTEHVGGFVVGERAAEHATLAYGVYRTNTAFMHLAAECYGPAQRSFYELVKAAVDPSVVLVPGKSGISTE